MTSMRWGKSRCFSIKPCKKSKVLAFKGRWDKGGYGFGAEVSADCGTCMYNVYIVYVNVKPSKVKYSKALILP